MAELYKDVEGDLGYSYSSGIENRRHNISFNLAAEMMVVAKKEDILSRKQV